MSEDAAIPLIPDAIGPYQLRGTLGEGASSVVKLAFNRQSFQYFACKVISKKHLATDLRRAKFENEIRIMQQLHHPGIVELVDLLKDDNFYYIVMELCARGELFEYIIENKRLTENESRNLIREVFVAVKYCHEQGIAHRDLKPENLLFDAHYHVKISDFGLSRISTAHSLTGTPCGSPCYTSPECLSGKPYNPYQSDVWSCGVILYAMVTGQLPWAGRSNFEIFDEIKKGSYRTPTFLSDGCRDLIIRLMCVDASKRITIDEALVHPWMACAEKGIASSRLVSVSVSMVEMEKFFEQLHAEMPVEMVGGALKRSASLMDIPQEVEEVQPAVLPPIEKKQVQLDDKRANAKNALRTTTQAKWRGGVPSSPGKINARGIPSRRVFTSRRLSRI